MRHSKRIIAMLLTAICLMGILPLSVSAEEFFEVGKLYFFNNDGERTSYNEGIFTGAFSVSTQPELEILTDLTLSGTQFQVVFTPKIPNDENSYDTIDVTMLCFGSGIIPNSNGVPIFYPNIGVVLSYDGLVNLNRFTISIADLEQDAEIVYSSTASVDKVLINIQEINYDESSNLPFLASWFTEDAEEWEIGLRDILRGWTTLGNMLVSSIASVYNEINVLSTVSIIVLASALALCMVLLIKRIFERS